MSLILVFLGLVTLLVLEANDVKIPAGAWLMTGLASIAAGVHEGSRSK